MGLLKPYIDRLEKLYNELDSFVERKIDENEDMILEIVRKNQLGQGYGVTDLGKLEDLVHPSKRNGGNIPKYEPSTENYWAKKSPFPRKTKKAGARYNFEWTGNTFDSMKINAKGTDFDIDFSLKRALEATYDTSLSKLSAKSIKKVWKDSIMNDVYEKIFSMQL
jgi:hypothetical protein